MYDRYAWERQEAEQARWRRIERLDWTKWEDVEWRLDEIYDRNPMNAIQVDQEVRLRIDRDGHRDGLPVDLVLRWLGKYRQDYDRHMREKCLTTIAYAADTHEKRVMLMNSRMFGLIAEYQRRGILDSILENGDFTTLGVGWFSHFPHLNDMTRLKPVREQMEQTHAIEFVLDGGDMEALRVDAWLHDRLERGLGAPPKASKLTAEFFMAAALIGTESTPKHMVVQLASEAILKVVGEMPWAARQVGEDIGGRVIHPKLKTLAWLVDRITGVMTDENAGVVLRWARASKRHHDWVRDLLERAALRYGWRLAPLVERHGELVVTWKTGEKETIVRQSADPEEIGELRPGGRVWLPRTRFLGEPVINERLLVVHEAPLHPAIGPTEAMREKPELFPL